MDFTFYVRAIFCFIEVVPVAQPTPKKTVGIGYILGFSIYMLVKEYSGKSPDRAVLHFLRLRLSIDDYDERVPLLNLC